MDANPQKQTVLSDAARSRSIFTTQAPFFVTENTYIIGMVAGDIHNAGPQHLGWLQSDFYAFNYLLKGMGKSQMWLTSADPRYLVDKYGPYVHGSPDRERRVVLSDKLLDAQNLSPVEVHTTENITTRFIQAVSEASAQAKANDGNLLILAFCQGDSNAVHPLQQLYFGANTESVVKLDVLRAAVDDGVKATLVCPACHVGGWLVDTDFNNTAILPSDESIQNLPASQSLKSISRACASVFAVSVMGEMTGIITDNCQNFPPLEADQDTAGRLYGELCGSVHQMCGRTFFEGDDHFSFSAQNDGWEDSWPDNTGIASTQFKSRWEALEIAQVAVEPPSDSSVSDMVCATGFLQLKNKGNENPQHPSAASPAESLNPRLKLAIDRFLEITPASSYIPGGPRVKGFLKECVLSGDAVEETPEDDPVPISNLMNAWHVMRFRTEFAALLTYIVDRAGLSRPSNKRALEFDHDEWWEKHLADDANFFGPEYKEFSTRFGIAIYAHLDSYGTMVQGGRFTAMARYADSSIFEYFRSDANLTIDDAGQKWQEFQDLLQEIGRSIVETAKQDENLKQISERYRVSVGKA